MIVQVLLILFAIKNILGDVPEILIPLDEHDKPLNADLKFVNGKWKLVADGTTTLEGYFIFPNSATQINMEMDYPGKWPEINKEVSTLLEMTIDSQTVNIFFSEVMTEHQIYIVHNGIRKQLYLGENKKFYFVIGLDGTVGVKNEKQINLVGGLNPIIAKDGKKAVKFSLTVKNAPAIFSMIFDIGVLGFSKVSVATASFFEHTGQDSKEKVKIEKDYVKEKDEAKKDDNTKTLTGVKVPETEPKQEAPEVKANSGTKIGQMEKPVDVPVNEQANPAAAKKIVKDETNSRKLLVKVGQDLAKQSTPEPKREKPVVVCLDQKRTAATQDWLETNPTQELSPSEIRALFKIPEPIRRKMRIMEPKSTDKKMETLDDCKSDWNTVDAKERKKTEEKQKEEKKSKEKHNGGRDGSSSKKPSVSGISSKK
uniref:Uncharacterized protein n=1 Tax=Panagrolaimus sp. JU765 TaxID=591449 RepID=A0AC34PVY3_9BILA